MAPPALPPKTAAAPLSLFAWRRAGSPGGHSLVQLERRARSFHAEGWEVIGDSGEAWVAHFRLRTDAAWRTRAVVIESTDAAGSRRARLAADGAGSWLVGGQHRPDLDGCLDVDLAAAPFTNTLPIRRLGLAEGEHAEIRAAWIDVPSLAVRPMEQRYTRLETGGALDRYEYRSLPSGRRYLLSVDDEGIVVEYEALATRVFP
jgi:uncharacterized protein